MSDVLLDAAPEQSARLGLIDCDIHPMLASRQALFPT